MKYKFPFKIFTKKEDSLIKKYIGKLSPSEIGKMIGKTGDQVRRRRLYLGIRSIKKIQPKFNEERKKIQSTYLKGRTFEDIYGKEEAERQKALRIKTLKGHPVLHETRAKIKEARKKQITPMQDTSIEIKIQNFLKQLGIEYFTHQYINIRHGYQCDILIPLMNMVIECDGNYWHKYPIGNELDHIRTSELIQKGFKVLRLWEFEINKMTLDEFKKRLNNGSLFT